MKKCISWLLKNGHVSHTGTFKVNNVTPQPNGESSKVKVKVRINAHGIFSVVGATLYEKTGDVEEESMEVDEEKKEVSVPNGPCNEVSSVFHITFQRTIILSIYESIEEVKYCSPSRRIKNYKNFVHK